MAAIIFFLLPKKTVEEKSTQRFILVNSRWVLDRRSDMERRNAWNPEQEVYDQMNKEAEVI